MNRSKRMRRKRQMQKRRRFFSLLFIVLAIFIVKKIDIPARLKPNIAEASALSESIKLMSDKSSVNLAFDQKRDEVVAQRIEQEKEKRAKIEANKGKKIAYLTFDDGPSSNVTPAILDVLKEKDVKATFFVIGEKAEEYPNLVKRANNEGHALANHSYTHDYEKVYKSTDSFLEEMRKTEQVLKDILGEAYETKVIRFPGGSHGEKKEPFRKAAVDNGYRYYDWNALNGDAEGNGFTKEQLLERLKETTQGQAELVVLMHDMGAKQTTADGLPEVIDYLRSEGYEFGILE